MMGVNFLGNLLALNSIFRPLSPPNMLVANGISVPGYLVQRVNGGEPICMDFLHPTNLLKLPSQASDFSPTTALKNLAKIKNLYVARGFLGVCCDYWAQGRDHSGGHFKPRRLYDFTVRDGQELPMVHHHHHHHLYNKDLKKLHRRELINSSSL